MTFMTAYVQNNPVDAKELPALFQNVKNVVFNVAGEIPEAPVATVTAVESQPTKKRGRKPRTLVVGEVAPVATSEVASGEDNEKTVAPQDSLPFLAVVGSEPVQKRGRGRPRKNPEVVLPDAPTESENGYKFAHISRTPFNGMDPEDAIKPDSIINLIDGVEQTFIRRALDSKYGMTPEEYRAHFNLRDDYPMTAPNYSKKRQAIMNKTIADQRAAAGSEASEDVVSETKAEESSVPRRRGRPPRSATAPKDNEAKTVKRGRRPKDDVAHIAG
jgi:predicted transcriptional regulator